jgi:hypothetical protein
MVTFNDSDEFFETVAEGGGTAYRFKDIDGIGPKTANKIKQIRGVTGPQDIAEYSADDLAEEAGISKKRATKAINGGGGNPSFSETQSTGSIEAGNLANAYDDAQKQAAGIVEEREGFFSELVNTADELPDRISKFDDAEELPFTDRDPDEIQQLGQAADIFQTATREPLDATEESPDTGFDESDREKASQVRIAAQTALQKTSDADYDEASSKTRGSPSNAPNFGVVESVLGFGATRTVGQFEVSESEQEQAREAYADQSPEAKQVDSRRRAPVTTDADTYSRNPGELDFPGVDTPSKDPKTLPKDYKKGGRPDTTDPDEQEQAAQTSGFDAFPEAAAGGSMEDAFMAEMAGRDVPASPDEVTRGVGAVSPNALGGNFMNEGERAPTSEPEAPSDKALRRQQRTQDEGIAGADTRGADIAFVYQNEGQDTDLSLSEFRDRTKRVGRKLGLEGDAFGNAQMVAYDEDVNEKF